MMHRGKQVVHWRRRKMETTSHLPFGVLVGECKSLQLIVVLVVVQCVDSGRKVRATDRGPSQRVLQAGLRIEVIVHNVLSDVLRQAHQVLAGSVRESASETIDSLCVANDMR